MSNKNTDAVICIAFINTIPSLMPLSLRHASTSGNNSSFAPQNSTKHVNGKDGLANH